MRKFKYIAVNLQNEKIRGTFIAKDERDLAAQLAKQSLFLTAAVPYSDDTPSAFFTLGTGKVNLNELTVFCRQFAIMLNTHIPLLECLDILRNQAKSSYFRKILEVVYEDVKGGSLLAIALDKHAKVFPDFFRSMVAIGESSGRLDVVFNSIANYYEKDMELRRKIKAALSYPIVLAIMAVGIIALMLGFVIPRFKDSFSQMDIEPEGITKVVYQISDFLVEWWMVIVAAVMILGIIIFLALRSKPGRYFYDMLMMRTPPFRKIQMNILTSWFSRAFGLLLSSGMDLTEAMTAVEIVINNRYAKDRFRMAANQVRHGMSLRNALESQRIFPDMMIHMIAIGESSNTLDEVLGRSSNFFDTQVETSIQSFTSKIQPLMLVIMGGIIATLFIAVYSPMLLMMGGIG